MKPIHKLFTLLTLLIVSSTAFSQTPVEYYYDNAGNRVQRKVIILTPMVVNNESPTEQPAELVSDIEDQFNFSLYPNPTKGAILVEAEEAFMALEEKRMFVYDSKGKLLIERKFDQRQQVVELPDEATGSYLVKVTASGGYYADWRVLKK